MSDDVNWHRLNKVEEVLEDLRKEVSELKLEFRQSLAGYRAVWKFAVALASVVGALAALAVSWLK